MSAPIRARELLIAYLPKQRILFRGDPVFPTRQRRTGRASATFDLSFAKNSKTGVGVDQIASVHGRTAAMVEFTRALEDRKDLRNSHYRSRNDVKNVSSASAEISPSAPSATT